jgi:hypothetical protein
LATVQALTKAAGERAYSNAVVNGTTLTLTRINGETTEVAVGSGSGGGGAAWLSGNGVPAGGLAGSDIGDFYLNTSASSGTGDVYEKTGASLWTLRGNIRGVTGSQGPQGPAGPAGSPGSPGGSSGVVVKRNGELVGTRAGINFLAGANTTLTVTDDAPNGEVEVTIASTASGGGGGSSAFHFLVPLATSTGYSPFRWVQGYDVSVDRIMLTTTTAASGSVSITKNGSAWATITSTGGSTTESNYTTPLTIAAGDVMLMTPLSVGTDPQVQLFGSRGSSTSVPPTAPNAPTSVTASRTSSGIITVNWTAPTGTTPTNYTVYYDSTGTDGGWTTGPTLNYPNVTAQLSTLTQGTSYRFAVVALNGSAASARSAPSNLTPNVLFARIPQAPGAPTNLIAGNASVEMNVGSTNNNGGSAVTGFAILARIGTSGSFSATNITNATANQRVTVAGLTNGQQYYFVTVATNEVGSAQSIASVSAQPSLGGNPPSVPTFVGVISDPYTLINGAGTIQINPIDQSATSYELRYRRSGTSDAWVSITGITKAQAAGYEFNVSPLDAYAYDLSARSVNAAGSSAWSDTGDIGENVASTAPSAPQTLSRSASGGVVTLNWTAPSSTGGSSIVGYIIDYTTNGTTWINVTRTATGTTQTHTPPSGTVFYRIAARNSTGGGAFANYSGV